MSENNEEFVLTTVSGRSYSHVISAFQKCIRRSMLHEAMWYGTELYISGFWKAGFYRMQVMAMEDIGLANPHAITQVNSCYHAAAMFEKNNKKSAMALPYVHAILVLVNSKKSRVTDNLLCKYIDNRKMVHPPEMPDFALDMHTKEGRMAGRGNEHFFEHAGKLIDPEIDLLDMEDEIMEHVREMYRAKKEKRPMITDSPQGSLDF